MASSNWKVIMEICILILSMLSDSSQEVCLRLETFLVERLSLPARPFASIYRCIRSRAQNV